MHRIESSNMAIVAGKYQFKDTPPATTVNAAWANAIQEEICYVIEQMGLTVLTKGTDTKDQLWQSLQKLGYPYDAIVSSQITFNNIIEKVAANHYRIKTQYRSAFFKYVEGGYNTTSWLTGGDTWGYVDTNACAHIEFEAGTFIGCVNTGFYLNVNTEEAVIKNVWIKGNGVAGAITKSFKLDAARVKYINCKTSDRNDDTSAIIGFQGSGIAARDDTSSYDGCSVYNQTNDTTGDNTGFYQCKNLNNCYADTITANNVACTISGFRDCYNLTNCNATNFVCTGTAYGMRVCERVSNSNIEYISGSTGYGLYQCRRVSNCNISSITATVVSGVGAYDSTYLSNIKISGITGISLDSYGFDECEYISCSSVDTMINFGNGSYGFRWCNNVTSCTVNNITDDAIIYGFYLCNRLTGCSVESIISNLNNVYGFNNCEFVSACLAKTIQTAHESAFGYYQCNNVSACKSDTVQHTGAIGLKTVVGFFDCDFISACSETGTSNGGGGMAEGFNNCRYISSVFPATATNTTNDYVDTDDASITNRYSTPVSADGKWD